MSGAVPLLPHVLSQRAQDFLYTQGVTSLLSFTSRCVPNQQFQCASSLAVRSLLGAQPIVSTSYHYIQWQGLAGLNVKPGNIAIKCVISMPASLCLQGGDS